MLKVSFMQFHCICSFLYVCRQGSGNECDGVKPGTEVSFDVTVTAMSCSDSLKKSKG